MRQYELSHETYDKNQWRIEHKKRLVRGHDEMDGNNGKGSSVDGAGRARPRGGEFIGAKDQSREGSNRSGASHGNEQQRGLIFQYQKKLSMEEVNRSEWASVCQGERELNFLYRFTADEAARPRSLCGSYDINGFLGCLIITLVKSVAALHICL